MLLSNKVSCGFTLEFLSVCVYMYIYELPFVVVLR